MNLNEKHIQFTGKLATSLDIPKDADVAVVISYDGQTQTFWANCLQCVETSNQDGTYDKTYKLKLVGE